MDRIDIGTVLNRLDDTVDIRTSEVKTYGIRFLRDNGTIRTMLCRKNMKTPGRGRGLKPAGNGMYHLKRTGTMLVSEGDQMRSIKPATIFEFKDHQASEWITVFH
jgi:hypothetical protein